MLPKWKHRSKIKTLILSNNKAIFSGMRTLILRLCAISIPCDYNVSIVKVLSYHWELLSSIPPGQNISYFTMCYIGKNEWSIESIRDYNDNETKTNRLRYFWTGVLDVIGPISLVLKIENCNAFFWAQRKYYIELRNYR